MSVANRDPQLPAVHLRPRANWINDPNGLVYHDGWYHVFYQHNPYGPVHQHVHWGHFRSQDLLRWEQLPLALTPTPGWHDADGCFSGNAVSHEGRIAAFFSTYQAENPYQPVAVADSDADGVVFAKRPDLVVPGPPPDVTTFRDPYVWRDGDSWRMLVGAGMRDGTGAALLYTSPDLSSWTYQGPLHQRVDDGPGMPTGEGWECPQLAVFDDGRVLLITSSWYQRTGPARVAGWAGTTDGERHHFGDPFPLDNGPDFYAPAFLRVPDGRWLLWGWAWEAREEVAAKEAGWSGVLTWPREVTLSPDGRARQAPARELVGLRAATLLQTRHAVEPGELVPLCDGRGAVELCLRVTFGQDPAWGLRVATTEDGDEYLDLEIRPGMLSVDRGHASRNPRAHVGAYRMALPEAAPGGAVDLRVVWDSSIVEIFTGSGETMTLRCYPTGAGRWSLLSRGLATGEVTVAADVHALHPLDIAEKAL